jgi:outer membrane protein with beta-barrel domain
MIRRLTVLIFLLLSSHWGRSQILISLIFGDKLNSENIEFGLDLGYNFSTLTNFESSKSYDALNLGFYFDFRLKNQWFINTGVLVKSQVGLDKLTQNDVLILDPTTVYADSGSYTQKISYFHVPAAIKYRFKNHIYFSLGPQFALRTKASLNFKTESGDKTLDVKTDNQDLFNRLEVSAIAGIGYKLRKGTGMNIGAKYFYGLTNVFKDNLFDSRNSSFYVYVGIPIGRDKAEKEPK